MPEQLTVRSTDGEKHPEAHEPSSRRHVLQNPSSVAEDPAERLAARQQRMLVAVLVLLDVLVLAANVVHFGVRDSGSTSLFADEIWNGNLDGSHVEILGHLQLISAAVLLLFVWRSTGTALYGAWALALGVLFADDFFMIHELGGELLVSALNLPAVAGLRPQDLGELAVWILMALILGTLVVICHYRSSDAARTDSRWLVGLIVLLSVFAVVIDMLHVIGQGRFPSPILQVMTIVETAGELGVMTLILLVVHRMTLVPWNGQTASMREGVAVDHRSAMR